MPFTLLPRISPAEAPEAPEAQKPIHKESRYKESKYEDVSDDDEYKAQLNGQARDPQNSVEPIYATNKKSAAEGIEAWVFSLVLGLVGDTVMARMLTGAVLEMELGKLNELIDKALGIPVQNRENENITGLDNVYTEGATGKGDGSVANGTELTVPAGTWKWGALTTSYILAFCSFVTVAATCDMRITGACAGVWLVFFLVRSRFFQAGSE